MPRWQDLKPSTRQRFVSLEFDHPPPALEARIVAHESGIAADTAQPKATIAQRLRALQAQGLAEAVSTRALVHAALLITRSIAPAGLLLGHGSSFNISVGAAANDHLRRMCPKHRDWVLDEVDALPARLLALVRRLAGPG